MKKVLLVGEHPFSTTGNGNMMREIIKKINREEFDITAYVSNKTAPWHDDEHLCRIVPAEEINDPWGSQTLLNFIHRSQFDVLLMVGLDIWRYHDIREKLLVLKKSKGFKWGWIFPYDAHDLRKDWVKWANAVDFPCVYSKYGFDLLKGVVRNLRYFRPPLADQELFGLLTSEEEKLKIRVKRFPSLSPAAFVFGFIGHNQERKDPQKLLRAFREVKNKHPEAVLYLHTNIQIDALGRGFNLYQYLMDLGFESGDVLTKRGTYKRSEMVEIYQALDCLVNCSMQEGLSWTPLEAMLCGTPVIASETTAQTEMVNGAGLLVPCKELAFLPTWTENGTSWIESTICKHTDIADAMNKMIEDINLRNHCRLAGVTRAKQWLEGISDPNELLRKISTPLPIPKKKKAVLFVQHSSAGDVLMTTRCFKGIKERHPGLPLVYMTQRQFQDIVQGNPFIDEIVDYDKEMIDKYEILYNPHGTRILPGGFNTLDVKLSDMYPYFCKVKVSDFFIQEQVPSISLPDEFIVIHTTGGHSYRIYRHMDIAIRDIGIPAVQIGGKADLASQKADMDLRGKLTWRETAWVMKRAKAAVVIDSFPAHLAGALGTPVVVLFGPAPARVTGPIGNGKIICLEPNKLDVCPSLTNCHGEIECQSPCINTISPMAIRKALKTVLEGTE